MAISTCIHKVVYNGRLRTIVGELRTGISGGAEISIN
jgi:hypothetical protein